MNSFRQLARYGKLLLVACAFGLLAACGSRLTADNLAKVKAGMTTSEVKDILGSPTDSKTSSFGSMSGTVFLYKKGNTEVSITFVNDKVMITSGNFEK